MKAARGSEKVVRRDARENWGLLPAELRTLRSLNTPVKIQKFVDGLTYQYANTAGSPRRVLRQRCGHCLEGALVAAAAFRVNGHPPLVMDLEAVRDDDHVIALYRERGLWGWRCQSPKLCGSPFSRTRVSLPARAGAQLL